MGYGKNAAQAAIDVRYLLDALAAARAEREDTQAELAAIVIECKQADGALADAATVPTGNLERGIRLLTAELDRLNALAEEQKRFIIEQADNNIRLREELDRLRGALKTLIEAEDQFVSDAAVGLNDLVSDAVESARAMLAEPA